jgi:hypothetical protein
MSRTLPGKGFRGRVTAYQIQGLRCCFANAGILAARHRGADGLLGKWAANNLIRERDIKFAVAEYVLARHVAGSEVNGNVNFLLRLTVWAFNRHHNEERLRSHESLDSVRCGSTGFHQQFLCVGRCFSETSQHWNQVGVRITFGYEGIGQRWSSVSKCGHVMARQEHDSCFGRNHSYLVCGGDAAHHGHTYVEKDDVRL